MPKNITPSPNPSVATQLVVPLAGELISAAQLEAIFQALLDSSSALDADIGDVLARFNQSPMEIGFSLPGNPLDGTQAVVAVTTAFNVLAAQPGRARARVAALATTTLSLWRTAVAGAPAQVGTITFVTGSSSGTITLNADLALAIGDLLEVRGPTQPDLNLADVAITLSGKQVFV